MNRGEWPEVVKKSGLAPAIPIETFKTCHASRCLSRFFHDLSVARVGRRDAALASVP
jgi:hypothetical protein